jgi:hypothetical protein
MPVFIDELTTKFDIRDQSKVAAYVRKEVRAAFEEERRRNARTGGQIDPSDPSASGRPGEGG